MEYRKAVDVLDAMAVGCKSDELLERLKDDFLRAACRYARIRAAWLLVPYEQRQEMDEERKTAHNAFIDTCNILSRHMAQKGLDIRWRSELGGDRKVIGDFACYIHAYLGIKAR